MKIHHHGQTQGRIDKIHEASIEVKCLLDQYKDIVVKAILDSLPPMRYSIYKIYLIEGSILPNKSSYKMTHPQK